MSSVAERKCALLLSTLHSRDQRVLLAGLPASTAASINGLLRDLRRSRLPIGELAIDLLGSELHGLTESTSPGLDELVQLSRQLSPEWYARVLQAWTGVDRKFCLALLDADVAAATRKELARLPVMPPKLLEAIQTHTVSSNDHIRKAAA